LHQLDLGTDQFDGWIEVEALVRAEVASGVEGRGGELQLGLQAQLQHIFDGRQPFRERGGGEGWVGLVVGGEELVVMGRGAIATAVDCSDRLVVNRASIIPTVAKSSGVFSSLFFVLTAAGHTCINSRTISGGALFIIM
jgi:hypothetical protein